MKKFMIAAIQEAKKGLAEGGIPIGSVLVYDNRIIGHGHNRRVQNGSVILHAEMDALENAGRKSSQVYHKSSLYTTLSPCSMCTGTILLYGIPNVIIGENISFKGEESLLLTRGIKINVLQDPTCIRLMKEFINNNPEIWKEDIGV